MKQREKKDEKMRKNIEYKILVILTCTLLIATSVATSVNAHEQTADKISNQIQPEPTRWNKTPATKNIVSNKPQNGLPPDDLRFTQEDRKNVPTSLTYTRMFQEPTLVTKQVKGSPYTEIVMPHTLSTGETPGAPTYPLSSVALLIPFGKTVSDITVCVETEEIITSQSGIDLKNAPLFPFQPSKPLDEQSSSSQFTINTETYKSENNYPGTDYDSSDVEFCRGFGILSVNLHPTEYFPKQGRLFYHPSMTIEVTLKDSNQMNRFYRANHDDRA